MNLRHFILIALSTSLLAASAKELSLDALFPTDRLIDVQIILKDSDWETIRRQSRNLRTALPASRQFEPVKPPYTYVNANVTIDGVSFENVGVRKKGFIGSQSYSRPSLKIKFNHNEKGANIGGLSILTLNNNRQDAGLISQYMGYSLFNAAGSPAPRCAYANVTVNGTHLGVYSHVESVREPLLKRNFGEEIGTLYEGTVVDFYEDWAGSFERKVGKKKPGRRKIEQLIAVLNSDAVEGDTLLNSNAEGRAIVPKNGNDGLSWTKREFDDSSWRTGRQGAGYEAGAGYQEYLEGGFDFAPELHFRNASVYVRVPFEVNALDAVLQQSELCLRVKYDDGFVAYLNGHPVASANAPGTPRWNSAATDGHNDPEAMRFRNFYITEHRDKLVEGSNLLALHGMNQNVQSSDMLILAELLVTDASVSDIESNIGELVDLDSFYQYWAMESLLGFWDGYSGNRNNFFVYLNPETDKLHFLPWGADSMFEKWSRLPHDRSAPISVKTMGMVANALYQIPSSRARYKRTLEDLLNTYWNEEELLAETKRIEAMIKPHVHQEQKYFSNALDQRRHFIRTRRSEIIEEIKDGMPVWPR